MKVVAYAERGERLRRLLDSLAAREEQAFTEWLAEVERRAPAGVSPFEHNIEVWRQLWRVLERSDVVAQIVDARQPLFYHSSDLDRYAAELAPLGLRVFAALPLRAEAVAAALDLKYEKVFFPLPVLDAVPRQKGIKIIFMNSN